MCRHVSTCVEICADRCADRCLAGDDNLVGCGQCLDLSRDGCTDRRMDRRIETCGDGSIDMCHDMGRHGQG